MRNIALLCLLCLTAMHALCQTMPPDKQTAPIIYSDVVIVDTTDAKSLYRAAKLWILNTYSTGEYACPLYDDENKTIVIAPELSTFENGSDVKVGYVHYTLTIECRDGRYKYTFANFKHRKNPGTNICDGGPLENEEYICPTLLMNKKGLWANIKKQTYDSIMALIADMKITIAKTPKATKGNW